MKSLFALDQRDKWALATFLYIGTGGAVLQLRGSLLPNIQETFSVSESMLGLITPAATITFTAVALSVGMIAGRIDIRKVIIVGVGVTAVTTALVGVAPSYALFLAAIGVRGLSAGIPGGLERPYLGHLFTDSRGQIFNIHEAMWALGAACGPLVATFFITYFDWRVTYIAFGLLFIPIMVLMIFTDVNEVEIHEQPLSLDQFKLILKNPVVALSLLALFLHVGVEGGFFTWLPYYMTGNFPQSVANLTLSGFLAAYVPGRLINGLLVRKFSYTSLLIVNSSLLIVMLYAAFYLAFGYWVIASVIGCGLLVSTLFPNLFSLATEKFPEYSGPINGLIMFFDPLGIAVVPALMGVSADQFGIEFTMKLLIVPMIGVVIAALLLRGKVLVDTT